jgi:hypothetical protein
MDQRFVNHTMGMGGRFSDFYICSHWAAVAGPSSSCRWHGISLELGLVKGMRWQQHHPTSPATSTRLSKRDLPELPYGNPPTWEEKSGSSALTHGPPFFLLSALTNLSHVR